MWEVWVKIVFRITTWYQSLRGGNAFTLDPAQYGIGHKSLDLMVTLEGALTKANRI